MRCTKKTAAASMLPTTLTRGQSQQFFLIHHSGKQPKLQPFLALLSRFVMECDDPSHKAPLCRSQWKRAVDTSDSMRSVLLQKDWITLSTADYTVTGKAALLLVAVMLPRSPQPTAKTIPAIPEEPGAARSI